HLRTAERPPPAELWFRPASERRGSVETDSGGLGARGRRHHVERGGAPGAQLEREPRLMQQEPEAPEDRGARRPPNRLHRGEDGPVEQIDDERLRPERRKRELLTVHP